MLSRYLHLDEKGIEHTRKNITIKAIFPQEGAKENFDKRYGHRPNVSSKLVPSGNQAVDNQIKAEVGQLLEKENQDVIIVSQDEGFERYSSRKKNNKLGSRILTAKAVEEALTLSSDRCN